MKPLRICVVTTWPPHKDGVALYSAELYRSMPKPVEVRVAANKIPAQIRNAAEEPKNLVIMECWKRNSTLYPLQILSSVLKSKPDIVHVQHGWLLFGGTCSMVMFPFLLCLLRLSRKPLVVTMHTVIRRQFLGYSHPLANILARVATLFITKTIAVFSSKIIIHNEPARTVLLEEFSLRPDKVFVIPHGVKRADITSGNGRERNPLILSFGFLRKTKQLDCLLQAFHKVSMKHSDAKLLQIGGTHAHDATSHLTFFKQLASDMCIGEKVVFMGFAAEDVIDQSVSASNMVVLLSSEQFYVESSGALARIADFERPVICSKVPKFQGELENGVDCIMVKPNNPKLLSEAINLLIENKELGSTLALNLKTKFRTNYWNIVARKHVELYEGLLLETLGT